jgi:7-carboxy-7-deazaguanine synthase
MPSNFDPAFKKVKQLSETLNINEVYLSLQGESTFAGLPCVFIRLTACNLRCSYCDTAYAFTEGREMPLPEIIARVDELASPFRGAHTPSRAAGHAPWPASSPPVNPPASEPNLPLIELTGGEPLLQKNSLPLMKSLCDAGYTVLLETSGALDIAPVDPRVHRIMDLKCPSSGEVKRNRWQNVPLLKPTDEIKFVIGTTQDYDWAKEQLAARQLASICSVLFSWVSPLRPGQQHKSLKKIPPGQTPITRRQLVEKIIADALPVRFQLQMHKFIWPEDERGV